MESRFRVVVFAAALSVTGQAAAQDINIVTDGSEATWRGPAANALAGASLDQGNVSADGRRDLIVGAPGNGSAPGTVYIIFGGPIPAGELSLASAEARLTGASGADRFGTATASGNVRTTEVSEKPRDIAVGAPGANGGNGIVYLFATGNGLPAGAVRSASVAGGANGYALRILGRAGDRLGTSLATADLDNDGYREIVIGAPGTSRLYVVRGGTSLPAGTTIDLATPTTALLAEIGVSGITGSADRLGRMIAAGHVTPDAYADLVIAAPFEDGAAGRVYLLTGRAGGWSGVIDLATAATAVFTGVAPGDQAGTALAVADIDADGIKDIIIGSPTADPASRLNAGAVYMFWGRNGIVSESLAGADTTFWGAAAGDQTGAYVTTGSVNRDTPDDLVILAYGARGGLGELQVYYGAVRSSRSGIIDLAAGMSRRLYAEPSEGSIRTAAVFEVTGEGARDIIAGVPTANGPSSVNNGLISFSFSTRMILSTKVKRMRALPGSGGSASLSIANPGIGTLTWAASSNVPWLTVSPAEGQATAAGPATLTLRTSNNIPPGAHSATITLRSTTVHLTMVIDVAVQVVCCDRISDFDGDGVDDLGVYRPSTGNWMLRSSTTNFASGPTMQFGLPTDKPVPGDYDGDGRLDVAVYRPSNGIWYVIFSSTGALAELQWGVSTDVPMPADFNGDGRTELAIWRPSTGVWFIFDLATGTYSSRQWGISTDIPLTGDYDRDGKADVAAYRRSNGVWYVFFSSTQTWGAMQWGVSSDIPVPADYTGDGRTDLAIYRPASGFWYVYDLATASFLSYQWGMSSDKPAPKDYDGDGRTDLAIWRPSNGRFYIYFLGKNTFTSVQLGASGDVPLK
jgi:hypothetical protein